MTTTAWPGWDGSADGISPLRWYALMHRAETIREHYPLGLASVWTRINQGDYHGAVEELGRVDAAIDGGQIPRKKRPTPAR